MKVSRYWELAEDSLSVFHIRSAAVMGLIEHMVVSRSELRLNNFVLVGRVVAGLVLLLQGGPDGRRLAYQG